MADWEEIKRLAADFQRVQLSGTSLRLSERSCIEIVQKLIELKIIEVVYTTDGKEYLTPQELGKEIREELTVRGGRVNLVELQQALNVDLSHIETKVNELLRSDKNLTLILGQLIDKSYLDRLAEEINDKLQQQGLVTIAELTKGYDLPGDFISQTIQARLGRIIHAQTDDVDRNILYTAQFVAQHRAKIRGAFSAVTRPTSVASMIGQYNLQERLCLNILDELIGSGRLAGSLSGGRQEQSVFVPDVYTRAQNEWVDSFLKQNGYLEYDAVVRLGISDAKSYIKKRFKNEKLEYLESCCVGKLLQDQVESELEEVLSSGGWLDVAPLLPSICSPSDAHLLLQQLVRNKPSAIVICDCFVTSQQFLSKCSESFDPAIKVKAETAVRENPSLLLSTSEADRKAAGRFAKSEEATPQKEEKKEQRRKKPGGGGGKSGGGGGTQGREVKTKAVKKKVSYGRDRDVVEDDSDDEEVASKSKSTELEFMSVSGIANELKKQATLNEAPDEFVKAVAENLYRPLTQKFRDDMKHVFLQTMQSTSSTSKRKVHSDLSEKISGLWMNAKLFEKGITLFSDEVQQQLSKHLLQSVCIDMTNVVFNYFATDTMVSVDDSAVTSEVRTKILSFLPDDRTKQALVRLQGSLSSKNVDDFFTQLDTLCGPGQLEISLRKPDKKKERQLIFNHRQSLAEQLKAESDPAMTLHLAVTLLFLIQTQCMVYAPGRCVPQIVAFLKDRLPGDQHAVLVQCQDLVMKQLKQAGEASASAAQGTDEGDKDKDISESLRDLLPKVKDIALHSKRVGGSQDE